MLRELIKDGKSMLTIIVCVLIIVISMLVMNYSLDSKWVKIVKNNTKNDIEQYKNKFKVQYAYSMDMKEAIEEEMSSAYEKALRRYIMENKLEVSEKRISEDVKYYRTITHAISNSCEDITVDRYILTNDLYRYTDTRDWDLFKKSAFKKFMIRGADIVRKYYDNNKVVMPINAWYKYGTDDIVKIVKDETNCLLDNLKTESTLYHKLQK